MLVAALEAEARLGPQPPHQLDLLLEPRAAVAEPLPQRLELDRVPADPNTKPEPPPGQQVDLGGLLGDEHRLALRQDQHRADQLQRSQRGDEAEQDQDFVKRGLDRIGPIPAGVDLRVGADYVIEYGDVAVAKLGHRLDPGAHRAGIAAELSLWKHGADLRLPADRELTRHH